MGLFGKLISLGMDVVTAPVAVVKDTVTLGGSLTDTKSEIVKKAEQLAEDWDDVKDELKK